MALTLASAAHWALKFPKTAMLATRLFLDTRVSPLLKLGAIASAVLIVSPLDVFGDFPILGQIDDIALLMLLVTLFVRLCPSDIVREHTNKVGTEAAARWGGPAPLKNVTPK